MDEEIWEVLESYAQPIRQKPGRAERASASKRETLNTRDSLMRFLEEIDGDITVFQVREALENYK